MKYRGSLTITNELLHKLLVLPEEVTIHSSIFDPETESIRLFISSPEPVLGENGPITFDTLEGRTIPQSNFDYTVLDRLERLENLVQAVAKVMTDVDFSKDMQEVNVDAGAYIEMAMLMNEMGYWEFPDKYRF